METEKFDLVFVTEKFKGSLDNEDIFMDFYLQAFREILKFVLILLALEIVNIKSFCRFFQLMGSIFGFVCSDVKSKVEILEEFRENKEVAAKFESVRKMIHYERDKELLSKKDYVSGCRTLLRLHRGLGE